MPDRPALLLTCEHGGNLIPPAFLAAFRGAARDLRSHRGHDVGALALARRLARRLGAPLVASRTSRLLVDLNRSPGHRDLFSEWSRALPPSARAEILRRHYVPHRRAVERRAAWAVSRGGVLLHVAVHSFTPRRRGVWRRADVGLLYDPRRPAEAAFARTWQRRLLELLPGLRVRRNYPYRGSDDGLTTHLRWLLGDRYLGIELELNQRHMVPSSPLRPRLFPAIEGSLATVSSGTGWLE